MYLYLKALHIIFVVTWFAGLFYMPRLFIYATEANTLADTERKILQQQFSIMQKRLWYGITWPSAVITLIFGLCVLFNGGWHHTLFVAAGKWLLVKLVFVLFLYAYHWSLHKIFLQEKKGIYQYTSQQLRAWNEVATIFLFAIVMLAVVKESMGLVWGLGGLLALITVLFAAIRIYKRLRKDKR